MNSSFHKTCYIGCVTSLLALIILCVAWETWLAPLRPGGSWMAFKVLPLLIPLRGVLKRDVYTLQWTSMLILLYLIEGIVRATSMTGIDAGLSSWLALGEVALVCIFFFCCIFYLRPFKLAAKQIAQQAIQKAASSNKCK
jgi:uncharacterized membrane protein